MARQSNRGILQRELSWHQYITVDMLGMLLDLHSLIKKNQTTYQHIWFCWRSAIKEVNDFGPYIKNIYFIFEKDSSSNYSSSISIHSLKEKPSCQKHEASCPSIRNMMLTIKNTLSQISLNIQIREFLVYTLCVNVKINMSVVVLGIYT